MILPMNPADLSFLLCGLVIALGTLLVWAFHMADRWNAVRLSIRAQKKHEKTQLGH